MKNFDDKYAFIIIGLVVIVVIIESLGYFYCTLHKTSSIQKVNIVLTDSIIPSDNTLYDKVAIDSLMHLVKNHEQLIVDKYQYLLEQKEEENLFYSIVTPCVALGLSLFGFFGFKSIKSIRVDAEEKAMEIANKVAEKSAQRVSRKSAEQYMKDNLVSLIHDDMKRWIDNDFANLLKSDMENSIQEQFGTLERRLTDLIDKRMNEYQKENLAYRKEITDDNVSAPDGSSTTDGSSSLNTDDDSEIDKIGEML